MISPSPNDPTEPLSTPATDFTSPARAFPTSPVPFGNIGIQGGQGSFNEEAIQHYFQQFLPPYPQVKYLYTSDLALKALTQGEIDRAQCAIYNSVGGFVEETTQALAQYPVRQVDEFEIRIAHALMIRPDQDFSRIDTIMCHPQVLAQCKSNLQARYPHFRLTSGEGEWMDNAKTAEALATGRLSEQTAVMGSKVLATIYGLQIIADNLQDAAENWTRFIHLERL